MDNILTPEELAILDRARHYIKLPVASIEWYLAQGDADKSLVGMVDLVDRLTAQLAAEQASHELSLQNIGKLGVQHAEAKHNADCLTAKLNEQDPPYYTLKMQYDFEIERVNLLSAQLAAVRAEKDAAISCIPHQCRYCRHLNDNIEPNNDGFCKYPECGSFTDMPYWQWRGVPAPSAESEESNGR